MPPFASAAEARRASIAERLEKPEQPAAATADQVLTHGEQETRQTRAWLTADSLRANADPETQKSLDALTAEVDAAWDEFSTEVKTIASEKPETSEVDEGWDAPPISGERNTRRDMEEKTTPPSEALESSLQSELFSFAVLDEAIQKSGSNADLIEACVSALSDHVQAKYAERIWEDPEYREALKQTQESLKEPYADGAPVLCAKATLKDIIAIHETFGDRIKDVVKAFDILNYRPDLRGKVAYKLDDEEGEPRSILRGLTTSINFEGDINDFSLDIELPYDQLDANGERLPQLDVFGNTTAYMEVSRRVKRTMKKHADGTHVPYLEVKHEKFELPPSAMGSGLAAEVTRASLNQYDQIGVDAITLEANISQGGYAWATYGYGWNEAKMGPKEISELVSRCRDKILSAYTTAGFKRNDPSIQALFAQIETAEKNPLALTPQYLAALGKDGPVLFVGASGKYYTQQGLSEAIASGEESGPSVEMRGPYHAGKIGLYFNKWQGKIELKNADGQAGKNRKLLEQKIAKNNV